MQVGGGKAKEMKTLFKIWDKKENNWLSDRENCYVDEDGQVFSHNSGYGGGWMQRHDDAVVVWRTGKKDKNGVEIYAGDIVRYSNWNTVDGLSPLGTGNWKIGDVYFKDGRYVVRGNEIWNTLDYLNIEVIGNIYQNHDLIKPEA